MQSANNSGNSKVCVSVIIPVHNAEEWLEECLMSVFLQDFPKKLEVLIYDDSSTDGSRSVIENWIERFSVKGINLILCVSSATQPKGVGFAKNEAIKRSSGEFLCFLDADDVMHPTKIRKQYETCNLEKDVIVGCRFHRLPADSTPRYTSWANNLTGTQLYTQIYTSFGPTIIMPTWFCHQQVYENVGCFSEAGKGTPEDLLFFYQHLRKGGRLKRVEEDLLLYRYHPSATTFTVSEDTVWKVRLKELEENVLSNWSSFTIWNAGKQGRKFYRSLSPVNKAKVQAFCDVDQKKIIKGAYIYEESESKRKPVIPIVHFKEAKSPFILCVKLQMTKGQFEENLLSLKLVDGVDYFHFN